MRTVYTMLKRTGIQWLGLTSGLVLVFCIGIIVGWFLPSSSKIVLLEAVLGKFSVILEQSPSNAALALNIFLNNLLVATILYVSALFPIVTVGIIVINGILIGTFADLLWRLEALQPGTIVSGIVGLLPHGGFELTAIFLAGSLGLLAFIKLIAPQLVEPKKNRRQFLIVTAYWFTGLIVPLLVLAAGIEAYVSPRLAERVSQQAAVSNNQFAVDLNERRLAELNCVPQSVSNFSTDITQVTMLYDESIYHQLQDRSKVGQWEAEYSCGEHGWFVIDSFDQTDWSKQDAQNLLTSMLEHLQANFTSTSDESVTTVTTKLDGSTSHYFVTTVEGDTVVITQSDLPFDVIDLISYSL